jgi:hypothetical protein
MTSMYTFHLNFDEGLVERVETPPADWLTRFKEDGSITAAQAFGEEWFLTKAFGGPFRAQRRRPNRTQFCPEPPARGFRKSRPRRGNETRSRSAALE